MASTSSRSVVALHYDAKLEGTSPGLRREGLGQQRGRFLHTQLTRTRSHQRRRDDPSSQSAARCQADCKRPAHYLTAHAGIGIPDDDVEHEGGRQVAAPGHYCCPGFRGGS